MAQSGEGKFGEKIEVVTPMGQLCGLNEVEIQKCRVVSKELYQTWMYITDGQVLGPEYIVHRAVVWPSQKPIEGNLLTFM